MIDDEHLAARHALISNALARYAWAFDFDDVDMLSECFSEDAEVNFQGDCKIGRAAVLTELGRRRAAYGPGEIPWHLATNVLIRAADKTRTLVGSWYAFGTMAEGVQGAPRSFGWYDDLFVMEAGRWRVRRRYILRPWQQPMQTTLEIACAVAG